MSKWDNIYRKSIAAVIVVYNDYHALVDLVLSLSSQVESIVIIDNEEAG
ncbi:MAG: hypothetical protein KAI17_18695 [Thiotrichaceae bacterium]|nr:hypothetical protein [Thiotrichaceae bacterium]